MDGRWRGRQNESGKNGSKDIDRVSDEVNDLPNIKTTRLTYARNVKISLSCDWVSVIHSFENASTTSLQKRMCNDVLLYTL